MEKMEIKKSIARDTGTIASLGMFAYRIFPDTKSVNIQLLNGEQEERTVPLKTGETFFLRGLELCLELID
ncbi:hypothetical protein BCR24_11965 [Enterococcus ureilyticus]|uniref:Uncharacterized protein n=1 Tax=Enterococcus ureilyticus TaxID=1131292 RepID=A0A1E5HEW0_9ENTE|nr:hypothetical protein [Enterococcus ureilyticus]MBM7687423.1 hypothetical protein [Enterococcus ureilyticus]MBO0444721.1 hypothetical protein [Enterococcus ureilyticus]OEG23474.1 hypothetical protein BCR24_11965 [Enterococcus ureilyticus]